MYLSQRDRFDEYICNKLELEVNSYHNGPHSDEHSPDVAVIEGTSTLANCLLYCKLFSHSILNCNI